MVHLNFAVNQDARIEEGMIDVVVSSVIDDARELLIQCARPFGPSKITQPKEEYLSGYPFSSSGSLRFKPIILTGKGTRRTVSRLIESITKKVTRRKIFNH